ncbi:MAG: hypothetical protein IPI53_12085 [Saprospiraceae bacterium]|nr:hypothetical protein [Saprospiraceae bacterium]
MTKIILLKNIILKNYVKRANLISGIAVLSKNEYMVIRVVFFIFITWLISCARPCPKDIQVDEVFFQKSTSDLLPQGSVTTPIIFENATGDNLILKNQSSVWPSHYQIDVATLCERGDFLDKTVQTEYIKAPGYNMSYVSDDHQINLNMSFYIYNASSVQALKDTVLYEECSVWGQKSGEPVYTGGLSVITSTRGNDEKIPQYILNNQNVRFIPDTLINGKVLQNVYTNYLIQNKNMSVFYTVKNGIEGFAFSNGETWLRKN